MTEHVSIVLFLNERCENRKHWENIYNQVQCYILTEFDLSQSKIFSKLKLTHNT